MAASATTQDSMTKDPLWHPIGVFWDIENCSVPHGKSALALVQRVRDKFFSGHREVEFMCVCDTSKQNREVIEELNHAQVTVVHIHATSKNAADDKLRQSLRRFANAYPSPATAVLLSGDVNFTSELSDLRYRHRHHVILVHRSDTQNALLNCAHECHLYEEVTTDLPDRGSNKSVGGTTELLVTGLPMNRPMGSLHYRLRQLSDNCGGRVIDIAKSSALVRFPTVDATLRARKRLEGEDVFGAKIMVDFVLSPSTPSKTSNKPGNGGFRSPKLRQRGLLSGERSHSVSPGPQARSRPGRGHQQGEGGRSPDHRLSESPQTGFRGHSPPYRSQVYYRKSRSCDNGQVQTGSNGHVGGESYDRPVRDCTITPTAAVTGSTTAVTGSTTAVRGSTTAVRESTTAVSVSESSPIAVRKSETSTKSVKNSKATSGKSNTQSVSVKNTQIMTGKSNTQSTPVKNTQVTPGKSNTQIPVKDTQVSAGISAGLSIPVQLPVVPVGIQTTHVDAFTSTNDTCGLQTVLGSAKCNKKQKHPKTSQNVRNSPSKSSPSTNVLPAGGDHGNRPEDHGAAAGGLVSLDMKPERDKMSQSDKSAVLSDAKHKKNTDTNSSNAKSQVKKRRRRKSQSEKQVNKDSGKQGKVKLQPTKKPTCETESETNSYGVGDVAAPVLSASPDVIIESEYHVFTQQTTDEKHPSLDTPPVVCDKPSHVQADRGRNAAPRSLSRGHRWRGSGARPKHARSRTVSPHRVHKPRPMRPKYQSPGKYLNGYGGPGNQYATLPYQYATPPAVRKFNHYRYTTWRDCDGYYSQFGYSQHQEDGMETAQLKDVVDKYNRNHNNQKMSREVLFLQQQIYQEDQWQKAEGEAEEDLLLQEDVDVFCRDECHSAPPLPFHHSYQSPPDRTRHHSMSPRSAHKLRSPNFRRTPGASRPSSRQSHHSGGGGSRPGSSLSMKSNSSYGSYGHYSHNSGYQDDNNHFQPIRNTSSPLLSISDLGEDRRSEEDSEASYVELMVSNLDYNISAREWRKILYAEFHQHVQVIGVYIQTQPDNTNIGFIKVPAIDDARFAISQFHRKKIGYKRIHVTLVNRDESSAAIAKTDVVTLLQEVPSHQLSLYKLMELYEKRFQHPVTVSDLYSFQDVLEIWELEGQSRVVRLIPSSSEQQTTENMEEVSSDSAGFALCTIHCSEGSSAFQDAMESCIVLFVTIQLKSFSAQVHTLIQSHEDCLPLASFSTCYSCEFGPLPIVSHGGVPLEHVISCVPGVKVDVTSSGTKNIQWAENKPLTVLSAEHGRFCASPLLNQQLLQFSREVVELLRYSPQCRLPFNKFIPTYHHTLGRQCRVADYGYTKLLELFDAIPHVVQVIGVGNRKYVTLTHRAQMKRFAMDMLRVLKSQASKQISVLDLPIVYNKVMGKPFDITEYGLCYLEDVLSELPENTISVSGACEEMVLSIPRRDQTSVEMEMTKQFALEVVDLLKHTPQSRMPFHRFIPAYHHHFGKQCRVSDYGFTKLVELFEAIPHVLKILDEQEDKVLTLVEPELLKVLEDQVVALLKSCPEHKLPVPEFLSSYTKFHGHSLRLQDYGVTSVVELVEKLHRIAQVESREGKYIIKLVDHSHIQMLAHHLLLLLMDQIDGAMILDTLQERYKQLFGYMFTEAEVIQNLQGLVQVAASGGKKVVKLCPLQMFARDIRSLLRHHNGKVALGQFEAAYATHFGVQLVAASYGYPSTTALLQAIPHVAQARGKGHHKTVLLCQDFQGKLTTGHASRIERATSPLVADAGTYGHSDADLMSHTPLRNSPYDFLSGSVPSAVPSPELTPSSVLPPGDLMRFDHTPISVQDFFNGLSPDEKRGQKSPLCKTPVSEMLQFAAQLLPTESGTQTGSTPAGGSSGGHHLHPYEKYHRDGSLYVPQIPPFPTDAPHVAVLEQQMGNRANSAAGKDGQWEYKPTSSTPHQQQIPYYTGSSDTTPHHQGTYPYGRPTIFNTPSHETYQPADYNHKPINRSPHGGTSTNAEDRKLLSLLQGRSTTPTANASHPSANPQATAGTNIHGKEIFQQQTKPDENTSQSKPQLDGESGLVPSSAGSEQTTASVKPAKQVGGTLFWMKTEAIKQVESTASTGGGQALGTTRVSPAGCEDPLPTPPVPAASQDSLTTQPKTILLPPSSLVHAPASARAASGPDEPSQPDLATPSILKLVTPASLAQADVPSYKLMTPAALTMPKLAYSAVVAQGSNIHKPASGSATQESTEPSKAATGSVSPALATNITSPKRSPRTKVSETLYNPSPSSAPSSPAQPAHKDGGLLTAHSDIIHSAEASILPAGAIPTPTRCVSGSSLADDDMNDSSLTSSPSPSRRQGTPRKSRLAAKFTSSPSK